MDIKIDATRRFDVMRGMQVLEHFDTYEQAQRYASSHFGVIIRYWMSKE